MDDLLRAVLESPRKIRILAVDRNYRYLAFNDAHREGMKDAFQVDIQIGQSVLELIRHETLRERSKQNLDRVLAGEHFTLMEKYTDQRGVHAFEILYCPILGADNSVVGVTAFHTDITEQQKIADELEHHRASLEKLVEERTAALRGSEELYRTLVLNAPVAVLVHREDALLYVNPAAVRLFGTRDAAALLEQRFSTIVSSPPSCVDGASRVEVVIRTPDGAPVDVEWTSIGVDFEGSRATLSLAVDVSSRKSAEVERRRLEEQMRETQKLESLGVLAGGIAHDFNNLLVGILGNADIALNSLESGSPAGDVAIQLQRIKTAAVRAAELTGQMLAYSGQGRFVVRPIDLNELTREMADLVGVTIPKSASVVFDLEPNLPAFDGDCSQIRQIVMNLVTNGAESLRGEAGTITIRTSTVTADRALLAATFVDDALAPGRYVCLEVCDTGTGMDASTRTRIFDPFFTTKASGRGLGLAAVVGIVRSHEGAITVESELGHGTTFRVFLPCSDRIPTENVISQKIEGWRSTGTVLIADDEPRVRQVLTMMLGDIGFNVLEAATAPACLDLYRANAKAIDAVMVDLEMPGGGGREVVRVLRAEGHLVPIVVSSGYSEDAVGQELRSDPRLTFLEKPFEYATFIRTLKGAMSLSD